MKCLQGIHTRARKKKKNRCYTIMYMLCLSTWIYFLLLVAFFGLLAFALTDVFAATEAVAVADFVALSDALTFGLALAEALAAFFFGVAAAFFGLFDLVLVVDLGLAAALGLGLTADAKP
jgi:hypothetical protein